MCCISPKNQMSQPLTVVVEEGFKQKKNHHEGYESRPEQHNINVHILLISSYYYTLGILIFSNKYCTGKYVVKIRYYQKIPNLKNRK